MFCFFLQNGSLNPFLFRKIITLFWSEPVRGKLPDLSTFKTSDDVLAHVGKRSYGFNDAGENCGLVNSYAPISYCAKYVAKDIYYDKQVCLYKYKKGIQEWSNVGNIMTFDFFKFKSECMPFVLMSNNLGIKFIESLSFESLCNGYVEVIESNHEVQKYYIPKYALRKILYIRGLNDNGNMHYMLNKLGYDVKKSQLKKQIINDASVLPTLGKYAYENNISIGEYTKDNIMLMFEHLSFDESKFIMEYYHFYRNKLSIDFKCSFDSDFDLFKNMQTKLRKAPFLFSESHILELCYDISTLEDYCKCIDLIRNHMAVLKAKERIHNEMINKRFKYGKKFIEESEIEVLSL